MRVRLLALVAAGLGAIALLVATGAGADPHGPGALGRLAFAIKDGSGVSNIYSVKPDGGGLVRLTNTPARDLCPDYSRDGRLITFCSSRSGPFQIWAMNADGSNVHMVTNGNGFFLFPDYSPDASRIAFSGTASDTDVNDNVYVINADGTGFKQLTTDGNNDYPTFSPDGKQIAFISDRTGVEQVWVMNDNGTNQTQVSHSGVTEDQVPDWSPNGKKIAFEQGDIGSGRIWVMNADGSNPVQLTRRPRRRLRHGVVAGRPADRFRSRLRQRRPLRLDDERRRLRPAARDADPAHRVRADLGTVLGQRERQRLRTATTSRSRAT